MKQKILIIDDDVDLCRLLRVFGFPEHERTGRIYPYCLQESPGFTGTD